MRSLLVLVLGLMGEDSVTGDLGMLAPCEQLPCHGDRRKSTPNSADHSYRSVHVVKTRAVLGQSIASEQEKWGPIHTSYLVTSCLHQNVEGHTEMRENPFQTAATSQGRIKTLLRHKTEHIGVKQSGGNL